MNAYTRCARLAFDCVDIHGRTAHASVATSFEDGCSGWIWHAHLKRGRGRPAEILGFSRDLNAVRRDVCEKAPGFMGTSDDMPPRHVEPARPVRSCVIEGMFVRSDGAPGQYRAERKDDGVIWTVEIVSADGDCFDSIEIPSDAVPSTTTDAGARTVIADLLLRRFRGARSA
ncbi:hypothetical protein KPL74_08410 [Bacillus sp. NP157]|nr:hypothetical protein KPL74_08410 [Bacillus sp. NP157]